MSAESFIAYFGLRFEIGTEDIERIEQRTDHRLRAARRVGLKVHYGDFDAGGGNYLLFVGAELGIFGAENSIEKSVPMDDMRSLMEVTQRRLGEAGLGGVPAIHLIWQPDA